MLLSTTVLLSSAALGFAPPSPHLLAARAPVRRAVSPIAADFVPGETCTGDANVAHPLVDEAGEFRIDEQLDRVIFVGGLALRLFHPPAQIEFLDRRHDPLRDVTHGGMSQVVEQDRQPNGLSYPGRLGGR